ncbi:MAG: tetratricopeptide repeat protein [Deltaproteobacteria bacterium]|nr:tetratricopeptide repeat protein [Deltaproteobacteria bacterium]
MSRRVVGVVFALLLTLFRSAVSGEAADTGSRSRLSGAERPFLSSYFKYSAQGSRDLIGIPVAPSMPEREISRLENRLREELRDVAAGEPAVEAVRRVLLVEEGFTYDKSPGEPENYLLETVVSRKRGNCLGLSMLYLALAERLGVPFRGVYVPSHCFVRYEGAAGRTNVEFSDGGAAWDDERYRREFRVAPGRPYLLSLRPDEMLGVFLKSLGAGYSRRGRDADALRIYEEAARRYPGLPDVHYNAGVSLHKLGRLEEAGARYRLAIALDPEMAAPRENLGILLARSGRYAEAIEEGRKAVELEPRNAAARGSLASSYCGCGRFEEGIREFRMAVELEPRNARARAGLAQAYFAMGSYREAAGECDRAEALGCRFEPSMLETLSRYRDSRSPPE